MISSAMLGAERAAVAVRAASVVMRAEKRIVTYVCVPVVVLRVVVSVRD